jgi:hypothetical protein
MNPCDTQIVAPVCSDPFYRKSQKEIYNDAKRRHIDEFELYSMVEIPVLEFPLERKIKEEEISSAN